MDFVEPPPENYYLILHRKGGYTFGLLLYSHGMERKNALLCEKKTQKKTLRLLGRESWGMNENGIPSENVLGREWDLDRSIIKNIEKEHLYIGKREEKFYVRLKKERGTKAFVQKLRGGCEELGEGYRTYIECGDCIFFGDTEHREGIMMMKESDLIISGVSFFVLNRETGKRPISIFITNWEIDPFSHKKDKELRNLQNF